jgi:hypothetical protein
MPSAGAAIAKNYSQYSKIFITALAVLTLDKKLGSQKDDL